MPDKQLSLWHRIKQLFVWVAAVVSGLFTFGYALNNYIDFSKRFESVLEKYEVALKIAANIITRIPFASISPATLNNYAIILGLVFTVKSVMVSLNNKIAGRFEEIAASGRFDFQREAAADMARSLKSTNKIFWSVVTVLLAIFFLTFFLGNEVKEAVSPLVLVRIAFWGPIGLFSVGLVQDSFSKGRGFRREMLSTLATYYITLGTVFFFLATYIAPETTVPEGVKGLFRLMIPNGL